MKVSFEKRNNEEVEQNFSMAIIKKKRNKVKLVDVACEGVRNIRKVPHGRTLARVQSQQTSVLV